MIDSVVDRVEEHVDLGGSQFSKSIFERWYFGGCFTMECGSPGILKSMSASILSRSVSSSVERSGLMIYFRVVLYCNCVFTRSLRSIMSLLKIETLAVFR